MDKCILLHTYVPLSPAVGTQAAPVEEKGSPSDRRRSREKAGGQSGCWVGGEPAEDTPSSVSARMPW